MPVAHARRLCPQAEFVAPHFPRYAEVSQGVMALFREITPLVEPLSLDEAFLDVGGSVRRLGMSPAGIGEWIRGQVYDAHRVTCSVGVAPSKFLAKLASDLGKDAKAGLRIGPRAGSVASYTIKLQNGTISFPDTAASTHPELGRAELFALQVAQSPCGLGG